MQYGEAAIIFILGAALVIDVTWVIRRCLGINARWFDYVPFLIPILLLLLFYTPLFGHTLQDQLQKPR